MKRFGVILVIVLAIMFFMRSPFNNIKNIYIHLCLVMEDIYALYKTTDVSLVVVSNGYSRPDDLDHGSVEKIRTLMVDADVSRAYVSCYQGRCSSTFYIDIPFEFVRPSWYYKYSSDGVIEEEIVPSIKEELEKPRELPYYFYCEMTEMENWFYCTSDG